MSQIISKHAHYFHAVLSDLRVATDFFSHYLPEVKNSVDLKTLHLMDQHYANLQDDHIFDMLFHVEASDGREGFLFILKPEALIPATQLCDFAASYIERLCSECRPSEIGEPFVAGIVFSQKENISDNYSSDLLSLLEKQIKNKALSCQHLKFIDLQKISDEELDDHRWSTILELVLKHIDDENIQLTMERLIASGALWFVAVHDGDQYFKRTMEYIIENDKVDNVSDFVEKIADALPSQKASLERLAEHLDIKGHEVDYRAKVKDISITKRLAIMKKLLSGKIDPEEVSELTGIPVATIKKVRDKLS